MWPIERRVAEGHDVLARLLSVLQHVDARDSLFFVSGNGGWHLYVLCSDTFAWATADAEEVTRSSIDVLEQSVRDVEALPGASDPDDGLYLFCARMRRQVPMVPAMEAMGWNNGDLLALFTDAPHWMDRWINSVT